MNASWIKFKHFPQTLIATQAPKPNTSSHFWQLVLEQKVKIVLVSKCFNIFEEVANVLGVSGFYHCHDHRPDGRYSVS